MDSYARCGCSVWKSSVDLCGRSLQGIWNQKYYQWCFTATRFSEIDSIIALVWRSFWFFPRPQWLKLIFGFSSFSEPGFLDKRLLFKYLFWFIQKEWTLHTSNKPTKRMKQKIEGKKRTKRQRKKENDFHGRDEKFSSTHTQRLRKYCT